MSRILFWGGVVSVVFMTLGIFGFAVRGGLKPEYVAEWRRTEQRGEERSQDVYASIGQVARAVTRWPLEPLAVVATGILLLLATPFVGVVAACAVFVAAGDRRYAAISAVLVAALLASVLMIGVGK